VVGLPSLTDIIGWPGRHDTRWYEAGASRLGADYFDNSFGRGAPGYFFGSPNHFDRTLFELGDRAYQTRFGGLPYTNPRRGDGRNFIHPFNSRFHWSDIPINLLYNGGLGLFGFF